MVGYVRNCGVSFLFFILASSVSAQDVSRWTGGYVGLQLGYLDGTAEVDYSEPNNGNNGFKSTSSASVDGTAGGIFAGYTMPLSGPWVYGFEVEYNGTNADGSASEVVVVSSFPNPVLGTYDTKIDATAALRGRIAYAMGSNLFYGSIGLAYVDYKVKYTLASVPGADRAFSATDTGWTIGAGYERDLGNQWSARIDYRYSDFGTNTLGSGAVAIGPSKFSETLTTSEIRIGFSKRF